MKKILGPGILAISGLLLLPISAFAGGTRTIDETRAAATDGRVEIENVSGSIEVVGWDRDEVRVSGTISDRVKEVEIKATGQRTSISVKQPRFWRGGDADLKIEVPRGSRVDVDTVSADITVAEMTASVELESVSGRIQVDGNVTSITAENVSGDIQLNATLDLRSAEIETVSGNLDLNGILAATARLSFESVSGDIILALAGGSGAELEMSTLSGSIDGVGSGDHKRGHHGEDSTTVVIGNGGARLKVETVSGSVDVRGGSAVLEKE